MAAHHAYFQFVSAPGKRFYIEEDIVFFQAFFRRIVRNRTADGFSVKSDLQHSGPGIVIVKQQREIADPFLRQVKFDDAFVSGAAVSKRVFLGPELIFLAGIVLKRIVLTG